MSATEVDVLIARLMGEHEDCGTRKTIYSEAAAELTRLQQSNAALVEALKPFAKLAEMHDASNALSAQHYRDERGPDYKYPQHSDSHQVSVNLGYCRSAKTALANA